MKKEKMVAALLALILAANVCPLAFAEDTGKAAQTGDKVEISFKVGDSTLYINQNPVTVEKPYVAGEGTTLVPLRVITEAFGAEVAWNGETKTIALTYPDVKIVLQIGSTVAEVNGHAETLAAAPVLTENGVTMVPLRFISETFGAVVSYDSNTQAISVVKDKTEEKGKLVGAIEKAKIGDSYYGWSMSTPKEMFMEYRSFDGMSTYFKDDYNDSIQINILPIDKDDTFDKMFTNTKDMFKGYTLSIADKGKDSLGNQYMHFQAKDKKEFIDARRYLKDGKWYDIVSTIPVEQLDTQKDKIMGIADTFKLTYGASDETYDLSNVESDGYRTFSDDTYKVSIKVPKDWYQKNYGSTENEFVFFKQSDDNLLNAIHFSIYSKSDSLTAKSLAESDLKIRKENYNPALCTFTDVAQGLYSGFNTYYYTQTISGSANNDGYTIDVFFENGNYVYDVCVQLSADTSNRDSVIEKVLGSIKAEKLDESKIGQIIRNDEDSETFIESKSDKWSLKIPASWKEHKTPSDTGAVYYDKLTGTILSLSIINAASIDATSSNFSSVVQNVINNEKKQYNCETIQDVKKDKIGSESYYSYTLKENNNGEVLYYHTYAVLKNNKVYVFAVVVEDLYYNSKVETVAKGIIESLEIK
ncbi:MAG: copper amine oxidase N-terminal domain-containing protein [Clostridia bacterium]|nr:copper amine oxidase N-terminal domain-containing protein [Clostridia bacterium]